MRTTQKIQTNTAREKAALAIVKLSAMACKHRVNETRQYDISVKAKIAEDSQRARWLSTREQRRANACLFGVARLANQLAIS